MPHWDLALHTVPSWIISEWKQREKAVYFFFCHQRNLEDPEKDLQNKINIDIPGRGIAFIVPLSSIGGKKILEYLTLNQNVIM